MPAAPHIQDAEMTSDPSSNDVAAGPGSATGLGDKKHSHTEEDSDSDRPYQDEDEAMAKED